MQRNNYSNIKPYFPKITCIVPVYNVEKYLPRCIDSILVQTFTDFELILIDDGSPDNCGKICDEYAAKDSRVKVIHQENKGVSSARNAGLDVAQGEYVCFVDSDDWVENNYFECLCEMIKTSKCDVAICGFFGEKRKKTVVLNQDDAIKNLFLGYGGFSQKKICFLSIINAVPKTRYNENTSYLEDVEFFYHLFKKCNSVYWDNLPLYHYEDSEQSITRHASSDNIMNAHGVFERLIEIEKNKRLRQVIEISYLSFNEIGRLMRLCKKETIDENDMQKYLAFKKNLRKKIWLCLSSRDFSFRWKCLIIILSFLPRNIVKKILLAREYC